MLESSSSSSSCPNTPCGVGEACENNVCVPCSCLCGMCVNGVCTTDCGVGGAVAAKVEV